MRPIRRATISARDGSPSLAGSVADINTPIEVRAQDHPPLDRPFRQRGAHDLEPRHRAQDHRGREQAERDQHPDRARVHERRDDVLHAHAPQREEREDHAHDRRQRRAPMPPRAASAREPREPWAPARGSSDGSRRARAAAATGRRPQSPALTRARSVPLRPAQAPRSRARRPGDPLRDARPREVRRARARGLAHRPPPRRIEPERTQRLRELERVARRAPAARRARA